MFLHYLRYPHEGEEMATLAKAERILPRALLTTKKGVFGYCILDWVIPLLGICGV